MRLSSREVFGLPHGSREKLIPVVRPANPAVGGFWIGRFIAFYSELCHYAVRGRGHRSGDMHLPRSTYGFNSATTPCRLTRRNAEPIVANI
jgi:hypothetical protein